MPHMMVEHSAGLGDLVDLQAFARQVHTAMTETGVFPLAGIRVRLHEAHVSLTADLGAGNHFLAMTLSVGAGRDKATLHKAGEHVVAAARAALAGPLSTPHFAFSMEIREIDPDLTWKINPIHARLKGETA